MMGNHHALSGAAAWVVVAGTPGLVPVAATVAVSPVEFLVGLALTAGAALLPDMDHHSATLAHAVPVGGRVATAAVGALSGGHRGGTHSLLAAVGILVLTPLMARFLGEPRALTDPAVLGLTAAGALLIAVAVKVLSTRLGWRRAWLIGGVAALTLSLSAPAAWGVLPVALVLGWSVHLLGDLLTTGGIPLFWPFRPRPPRWWRETPVLRRIWTSGGRLALPVLGRTGSRREWALLVLVGVYALAGGVQTIGAALTDASR